MHSLLDITLGGRKMIMNPYLIKLSASKDEGALSKTSEQTYLLAQGTFLHHASMYYHTYPQKLHSSMLKGGFCKQEEF